MSLKHKIININFLFFYISYNNYNNAGKIVIFGLISVFSIFLILILVVNTGIFRATPIFLQEKIEITIAFKNIDGTVKMVGIKGNGDTNPTLLMRIKDFPLILTVINMDKSPHMLYIDGLDVTSKFLRPGENDTMILYSPTENIYNYYDRLSSTSVPFGQIKAVRVTPSE